MGSLTSITGMKLCDRSFCALHCVQSHRQSLQHDFSKLLTQKYLVFLLCPVACCTLKLDQKWCFHWHLGLPNVKEMVDRKKIYASSVYMYVYQQLTSDCLNLYWVWTGQYSIWGERRICISTKFRRTPLKKKITVSAATLSYWLYLCSITLPRELLGMSG